VIPSYYMTVPPRIDNIEDPHGKIDHYMIQ